MNDDIESLDALLDNIENPQNELEVVDKSLPTSIQFDGKELDTTDNEQLTTAVLISVLRDKEVADEAYKLFTDRLLYTKDSTDSTKENLVKSIEQRNQASTNLVKILEIKTKATQQVSGNNFLNIAVPPKKAGIDIDKIMENIK